MANQPLHKWFKDAGDKGFTVIIFPDQYNQKVVGSINTLFNAAVADFSELTLDADAVAYYDLGGKDYTGITAIEFTVPATTDCAAKGYTKVDTFPPMK